MPPPPIQIQLSKFEHIEILRAEIDRRQEEQRALEKQIRDVMWEMERQRYLQSVHVVFGQLEPPAQSRDLPQMLANREIVFDAIQAMQQNLSNLEAETAGQTAPAAPQRMLSQMRAAGQSATQPATPAGTNPGQPRRAKFEF